MKDSINSKASLISIITVVFNGEEFIEKTINSVLNQTVIDKEYIIIDGNSKDNTVKIINKYLDNITYFISEPDNGIFDAMNKAIQRANGKWLIFMNAGDSFFDPKTLENLKPILVNNEKIDVLYGSTHYSGSIHKPGNLKELKYGGMPLCHQSILYNKESIRENLYYLDNYNVGGDIELTRRLYLKKFKFLETPIVISKYAGGGISSIVSLESRKSKFYYLIHTYGYIGVIYGMYSKLRYLSNKLNNPLKN